MGPNASNKDVSDFLKEFKNHLQNEKFVLVPRDTNLQTITYLGLSITNVKEILLGLTPEDYFKGPSKDTQRPEFMVWEFGKNIDGENVYIKLSNNFSCNRAKCISFHIAAQEIKYPNASKQGGAK